MIVDHRTEDATDRDAESAVVVLMELVTELAQAALCRRVQSQKRKGIVAETRCKHLDDYGRPRLENVGTRLAKLSKLTSLNFV
jgi:hypothetical protein